MPTTPEPTHVATMELRDSGWVVIYGGTVVGRHRAKYKAREQVDALNSSPDEDALTIAARAVVDAWRNLNDPERSIFPLEGYERANLETALDNAIIELEDTL